MKRTRMILLGAVCLAGAALANALYAQDDSAQPRSIGLFDVMNQGLVEAKLSPRSSLESTMVVKNLTKEPLEIDMPAAFAGVPILAQPNPMFGGPGMGGRGFRGGRAPGMGGPAGGPVGAAGGGFVAGGRAGGTSSTSSGRGGSQSVGGGFGGGGFGGGAMGGRGGMGGGWFVAPEKTVREKVRTVCLEHGKSDPRAGCEYAIVPIEECTANKTTQVLCEMLGSGETNQQAVQAAVWNQESGLTFEELSEKISRPTRNSRPEPWFTAEELAGGTSLLEEAAQVAKEREEAESKQKAEQQKADEENLLSGEQAPADTTIEDLTRQLKTY